MQVVPIESRVLTTLDNQIRDGVIRAYRILEGQPGPGNYSLKLVNIEGEFFRPDTATTLIRYAFSWRALLTTTRTAASRRGP